MNLVRKSFNKEIRNLKLKIENIKKNQSEMKNTINEEYITGSQI